MLISVQDEQYNITNVAYNHTPYTVLQRQQVVSWNEWIKWIDQSNQFGRNCNQTSIDVTLLHISISGFFVSPLVNKYGERVMTIIGSVFCTVGFVSSAFATNVFQLYVTYGLLSGNKWDRCSHPYHWLALLSAYMSPAYLLFALLSKSSKDCTSLLIIVLTLTLSLDFGGFVPAVLSECGAGPFGELSKWQHRVINRRHWKK